MRVFSLGALREFWESSDAPKGAEDALRNWYSIVEDATWHNFAELSEDFRATDKAGDCYVFDIRGNHIRLIAYVRFTDVRGGAVYIRKVMTHAEYDENKWPDECGCHKPRPKKGARPTKQKKAKRKK